MRSLFTVLASLLLATASRAAPAREPGGVAERAVFPELPRLVIYFQTTHDAAGNPISMLPLITEKGIALTHLIVCSFHINLGSVVHLNDFPPSDPRFDTLWSEAAVLRNAGVTVMGMVGGAAPGSFTPDTLDSADPATFEHYYGQLRDAIASHGLQGLDLDVEQYMSQSGIERLVRRLRHDFGPRFVITLAPVASALDGAGGNLSGFDYATLERDVGRADVAFYNAQFYNGFGSLADASSFDAAVRAGWDPRRIVAGQVTSPANGGSFVPFDQLNATIVRLRQEYGEIGGIMGWEYFNSEPGGTAEPWVWAQDITRILRPRQRVLLRITRPIARALEEAWQRSVQHLHKPKPHVNYMAMVNA